MSKTRITASKWIDDLSISTNKLADNIIITQKIADNQVTPDKLDEELDYRVNALNINENNTILSDGSFISKGNNVTIQNLDGSNNILVVDSTLNNTTLTGDITVKNINSTNDIFNVNTVNKIVTINDDLVVSGNLLVQGTNSTIESSVLTVVDKNIIVNSGGTVSTQYGSGLTVDASDGINGSIIFDGTTTSKWKLGLEGNEDTIVSENFIQSLTNKTLVDPSNVISSSIVTYSGVTVGLNSIFVQEAIDETKTIIDDLALELRNADSVLQTNINNEETRATDAENLLTSNLNNENSRAVTAENILQANIDTNTNRLDNITNPLASEVIFDNTTSTLTSTNGQSVIEELNDNDFTIQNNLNNEINRAGTAENLIQLNLTNHILGNDHNANSIVYDNTNTSQLGTELQTVIDNISNNFDSYVSSNNTRSTNIEASVSNEILRATNQETSLQSNIDIEKNRIDAILSASSANADSFAEIVNIINSVDLANDTAFANYVLSNDTRSTTIETNLNNEITRAGIAENLVQSNLDTHIGSHTSHASYDITFDNTVTAFVATDVQSAIDEVRQVPRVTGKANMKLANNGGNYYWEANYGGGWSQTGDTEPFYYDTTRGKFLSYNEEKVTYGRSGTRNAQYIRYFDGVASNNTPYLVEQDKVITGFIFQNRTTVTATDILSIYKNGVLLYDVAISNNKILINNNLDINLLAGDTLSAKINGTSVRDVGFTIKLKNLILP